MYQVPPGSTPKVLQVNRRPRHIGSVDPNGFRPGQTAYSGGNTNRSTQSGATEETAGSYPFMDHSGCRQTRQLNQ